MNLILGAGLAGLSSSYHLGHKNCLIIESKPHAFGHIHTELRDGFTWDEGPHVSFTTHQYVKDLFSESVNASFEEYPVRTRNYFYGNWIDHPAQSNLFEIPEPLRTQCLDSFLSSRNTENEQSANPTNYYAWLCLAFGKKFADTFPCAYTEKYWTTHPQNLTTEWVGGRVYYPKIEDVVAGSKKRLPTQTHYIKKIRYPSNGGYQAYGQTLFTGANIHYNSHITKIDLQEKRVFCANSKSYRYKKLINTIPLPTFIKLLANVNPEVVNAAEELCCSQLLLVNVTAPHPTQIKGNWFYIYDKNMYSTRINCTEVLSPKNAPDGCTGIQVEVYASKYKSFRETPDNIAKTVIQELVKMGFINLSKLTNEEQIKYHYKHVPFANVVFDNKREAALETILSYLAENGLERELDDLAPTTDWDKKENQTNKNSTLILAGRFGQWKYYWSDDCVLRGKSLSHNQ